jgi:hypothetical protein
MLNFGNKEFRNLQEQVLKNAQDIETLKGVENLKIVIVEELPEEGNPNYIYLVPNEEEEENNVYNEYIWLADEEAYEQIGAVNIDLTNYVTLDTEQTVTGSKTFSSAIKANEIAPDSGTLKLVRANCKITITDSDIKCSRKVIPEFNNSADLGESGKGWKDLYLSGRYYLASDKYIYLDSSNRLVISNNADRIKIGADGTISFVASLNPLITNSYDFGTPSSYWRNFYLAGNISDGTNSIAVANIASKVIAAYASGTFDSNGEDTIDISGGTPEGLFIFTYGNCQCFVRLTATMVQNADLTPICVSCPMIYNSNPTSGWLNISRSSDTLTISVVDGTNHVDSGYSWTLVKTGLI